uniref:Uncharacterized protein n=1 Tax=Aegilops tauschii subsp. strangulata TaxID=200361 RepID=A0A453P905_AEGTS
TPSRLHRLHLPCSALYNDRPCDRSTPSTASIPFPNLTSHFENKTPPSPPSPPGAPRRPPPRIGQPIARSIDPVPATATALLQGRGRRMVVGFRRTISFPAPKSAPAAGSNGKSAAGYRVRSASLPCRFHPLVLQLDEDVAALRDLAGGLASAATARSIAEAAEQLGRVLVSLSELLHHPQAQEPLRRLGRSPFAERLLDDFLRLADAHGSFRD